LAWYVSSEVDLEGNTKEALGCEADVARDSAVEDEDNDDEDDEDDIDDDDEEDDDEEAVSNGKKAKRASNLRQVRQNSRKKIKFNPRKQTKIEIEIENNSNNRNRNKVFSKKK